jgi:hypothetical protein
MCNDYCKNWIKQYKRDIEKWPNACKLCCGTGYMEVFDSVPYGSTSVSMSSDEVCECLGGDKCPRCNTELEWQDEEEEISVCPACKATFGPEEEYLKPLVLSGPDCAGCQSLGECDCVYNGQ